MIFVIVTCFWWAYDKSGTILADGRATVKNKKNTYQLCKLENDYRHIIDFGIIILSVIINMLIIYIIYVSKFSYNLLLFNIDHQSPSCSAEHTSIWEMVVGIKPKIGHCALLLNREWWIYF